MGGNARLRRPEYTGENRCWPCTFLNLVVLVVLCVALGLVWPVAGGVAGLVGGAVIWLRGYLFPYTPRIGPRLAGWLPFVWFHRERVDGSLGTLATGGEVGGEGTGEEVLRSLLEAGAIEPDGEDLALAERVRERWEGAMDELAATSTAAISRAALEASTAAESVKTIDGTDGTYVVLSDDAGNVAWLPRPVAIAETGAARALAAAGVPAEQRDAAAHGLCAFLDRCPVCDAEVAVTSADACCGATVPSPTESAPRVLACPDCDVRFFTLDAA